MLNFHCCLITFSEPTSFEDTVFVYTADFLAHSIAHSKVNEGKIITTSVLTTALCLIKVS